MAVSKASTRIMATVSKEQDELLSELARFQGRSKGSYLTELLDGAEPLLRALLPVLRLHAATIEGQPVAIRDAVARVMTDAYGDGPDVPDFLAALEKLADGAERTAMSEAKEDRTAPAAPVPKLSA